MYNETYDEYIRSILGYPQTNSYNDYRNEYQDYNVQSYDMNNQLENCYPEIYKIVYPMITKRCSTLTSNLTNDELERILNLIR